MRVGIITIHHVPNYGAVCQAYALAQVLQSLGTEVEIVDYQPTVAVNKYRPRLWSAGRPRFRPLLTHAVFSRFVSRHLPLSSARFESFEALRAHRHRYDLLIAGSDQIWCTGEGSFRGFDPSFFLEFASEPTVTKASYAASAGNTIDFGEHLSSVTSALSRFSRISARDAQTADLIARATGRAVQVVLDPVFLHDFKELVQDAPTRQELLVFSRRPERFQQVADKLARRLKLRIVALVHPLAGAARCYRTPTPIEWLRRLHSAQVVLTDYFHGLALATRFGRPVMVDPAPTKSNKIRDLLTRAGLDRFHLENGSDAVDAVTMAVQQPEEYAQRISNTLGPHLHQSRLFLEELVASINQNQFSPRQPQAVVT